MYLNNDQLLANNLPPIFSHAAWDVQRLTQAPMPLIVSSMLAVAAGVSQHWIDVSYLDGHGRSSPVSLYLLPMGESGERKSTVDALVGGVLSEIDDAQDSMHLADTSRYEIDIKIWETKLKGLEKKLILTMKSGQDLNGAEKNLSDHLARKPNKFQSRRFLYQDVSVSKLVNDLSRNTSSVLQLSPEASGILENSDSSSFAFYSQLWDGATLHYDRQHMPPMRLSNVRFSTCMMIQPHMFEIFIRKHGKSARGSGNLGRFLISYGESTQGSRFMSEGEISTATPGLDSFNQRLRDLMGNATSFPAHEKTARHVLQLDAGAKRIFLEFYNSIEAELASGRYLADVREMGSKAPENVARIAAVIHYFQGRQGSIDCDSMRSAVQLGQYFVSQYKQLLGVGGRFSLQYAAKVSLENWFASQYQEGIWRMTKRTISNFGPSRIRRDPEMLESVLNQLQLEQKIIRVMNKSSMEVYLNASYFNLMPTAPMIRIA